MKKKAKFSSAFNPSEMIYKRSFFTFFSLKIKRSIDFVNSFKWNRTSQKFSNCHVAQSHINLHAFYLTILSSIFQFVLHIVKLDQFSICSIWFVGFLYLVAFKNVRFENAFFVVVWTCHVAIEFPTVFITVASFRLIIVSISFVSRFDFFVDLISASNCNVFLTK